MYFWFVGAICDLVHAVEATCMCGLPQVLTASRASLIFQKSF